MDNHSKELTLRIMLAETKAEAEELEKELKDYTMIKDCMEEMD
jgi:hypothetical protein